MKARRCNKCGCTERRACIEFTEAGYAQPCHWVTLELCSGCLKRPPVSSIDFLDGAPKPLRAKNGKVLRVPELAGMVARPRR